MLKEQMKMLRCNHPVFILLFVCVLIFHPVKVHISEKDVDRIHWDLNNFFFIRSYGYLLKLFALGATARERTVGPDWVPDTSEA